MIEMKYGRKDATTPQCCVDEGSLPAGNAPFPDADTPQVRWKTTQRRSCGGGKCVFVYSLAKRLLTRGVKPPHRAVWVISQVSFLFIYLFFFAFFPSFPVVVFVFRFCFSLAIYAVCWCLPVNARFFLFFWTPSQYRVVVRHISPSATENSIGFIL